MIESPPASKKDLNTILLMVELQQNGVLRKIQDEYILGIK